VPANPDLARSPCINATAPTRAIRDLGGRFEHRLFLSATPHNGHSNSFSTLLELLDPYRLTRGVPVRGRKALEEVMVRRIKEDIREVQGGFPRREIVRLVVDGLPPDASELVLSRLLDEYRAVREERFGGTSTRTRSSAALLVLGLQQRLLSSIEAFAQSLKVHQRTLERQRRSTATQADAAAERDAQLLLASPGPDDEQGMSSEEELDADEAALIEAVTEATESVVPGEEPHRIISRREQELLAQMEMIAERSRYLPDYKTLRLIDWIRESLCPGLPPFGQRATGTPAEWTQRKVLIFTESREGTKRYLRSILEQAIAETERADERIEVINGLTSGAVRKEIQRRFNTDPAKDPLRILIATDAAREGLNFQAHCSDLFDWCSTGLRSNPRRARARCPAGSRQTRRCRGIRARRCR
jgi:Helicase conserved C-terminal domain